MTNLHCTVNIENIRLKPCEHCGSEGKIYTSRYGGNDPDVWPIGDCPVCEGTGLMEVETEEIEEEEVMDKEMVDALLKDGEMLRQMTGEDHGPWAIECISGCQYAKDVGMPEHNCGDGCMYLKGGRSKAQQEQR